MTRKLLAVALLSVLPFASPLPAAAVGASPLELVLARGGAVKAEPIVDGRYVHIPTGRVLATWDYAKPTAPLRIATTEPADGAINSVTRNGSYLYASWRGHDGTGGVAVYSLADPAKPVLVGQSEDYTDADNKVMLGVVAANNHLYLFDNNHGLFVGNLSDPAKPTFVRSAIDYVPIQYSKIVANGNLIQATGRGWILSTALDLYDVSNPDDPVKIAAHSVDGLDTFSLTPEPGMAIGIGNQLSVFDLSDPTQIVKRSWLDVPPATYGVRVGSANFYSFGWGPGMDVWNLSNLDAPRPVGHFDMPTFGGHYAVRTGKHLLLQTTTDLVHSIDVSAPTNPKRVATAWLPGGVDPRDIAMYRDRVLLVQPNYGLMMSDPNTLSPLSRFEARLPESMEGRSLEQVVVVGNRAYIAAWGFGLINVDLSNPKQPVEIGSFSFPFAAVLDVKGNYAYIAKWTNGGLFGVVDISNPAAPRLVWYGGLSGQPYRIKVDGRYAYMAESQEPGTGTETGGLRIFDLANPAKPVLAAHFNRGCGHAFDVTIDSSVALAYVACQEGMQVVDISNPRSPAVVGEYATPGYSQFNKVAQRGDRAWFANIDGLHELDVSDPTHPTLLKRTNLGHQAPQRLLAPSDGVLYVAGGETGVQVFKTSAGSKDARLPSSSLPRQR